MFGLGTKYFKLINKEYLKDIPIGLLCLNWIVQRIFRINSKFKFTTHYTSKIYGSPKNLILIGNKPKLSIAISGGCNFTCLYSSITIGENTIFANNVSIIADNHSLENFNEYNSKAVVIGEKCWLGTGVTILPGVILGNNVVVGANSVVTKSFEGKVVIAGIPAKIIKHLD